jgi:hypothetical protein
MRFTPIALALLFNFAVVIAPDPSNPGPFKPSHDPSNPSPGPSNPLYGNPFHVDTNPEVSQNHAAAVRHYSTEAVRLKQQAEKLKAQGDVHSTEADKQYQEAAEHRALGDVHSAQAATMAGYEHSHLVMVNGLSSRLHDLHASDAFNNAVGAAHDDLDQLEKGKPGIKSPNEGPLLPDAESFYRSKGNQYQQESKAHQVQSGLNFHNAVYGTPASGPYQTETTNPVRSMENAAYFHAHMTRSATKAKEYFRMANEAGQHQKGHP